jgi:hypothetical protein
MRRKPLKAGLLLGLFVFVLAMAQFKTLHRYCHAEANQADHQCVVTTLSSGMVDAPTTHTVVVAAPVTVLCAQIPGIIFVPSVNYSLLPSRGPPALLT